MMLLKGNARGGGRQLAIHLMNGEDNEHVQVHEISGFASDTVIDALNEAYAVSKGTRAEKFIYSLSLSPPPDADVSTRSFEDAIKRVEDHLKLGDQPRVIVFHEKHGRKHAHCVWSRINVEKMTAIPINHDHWKLKTISKSLYLEHGWQLPEGFRDFTKRSPFNYSREEWQQALRKKFDLKAVRETIRECWGLSDSKASFISALRESGYWLAKGDKNTIPVIMDFKGNIFPLRRHLKIKVEHINARLGDPAKLLSTNDIKKDIGKAISPIFTNLLQRLEAQHDKQHSTLARQQKALAQKHQQQRARQKELQAQRWKQEEQKRQRRIRTGKQRTWDKINGRYWRARQLNEKETWKSLMRDNAQKDELIARQLVERQALEEQFKDLRAAHVKEEQEFIRDFFENALMEEELHHILDQAKDLDHSHKPDLPHDYEIDH